MSATKMYGLEFMDLGVCILVFRGGYSVGVTRTQFFMLVSADQAGRDALIDTWLKEAAGNDRAQRPPRRRPSP